MRSVDRILSILVRVFLAVEKRSEGLIKRIRYEYWKQQLYSLGVGTHVRGRLDIVRPENVEIGRHCTLNEGVSIRARTHVRIGDYVRVSARAMLITGGLEFDGVEPPYKHYALPITIEDGAWIGAGAKIMPGVTVGCHSVVAAGAVVTSNVPPYTVVGGVPARVIRQVLRPGCQEDE